MQILKKLNQEHENLIPKIVGNWTEWTLKPTKTDKKEIKDNIRWLYKISNKKLENVIVCDTLNDFINFVIKFSQNLTGETKWDSIGRAIHTHILLYVTLDSDNAIRACVSKPVEELVRSSVQESVKSSIGISVGCFIPTSLGDTIWNSIEATFKNYWDDSVANSIGYFVGSYYWSQHLAYFDYFEKIGILTDSGIRKKKQKLLIY